MDERNAPELWWAFRFKDDFTDIAKNYTPEKMQRMTQKHGALIGIAPA